MRARLREEFGQWARARSRRAVPRGRPWRLRARFDGLVGAFQDVPRFGQEYAARLGEAHGLGGSLEKGKAELVLEVANLPAQRRLRDVQFQRGARDVLLFRGGDEIAEVAQFHPQPSIPFGYAEARNMVFPQVAAWCGNVLP